MKLLVITNLYPPTFLGGYELGCAQMVQRLRELGHEVRVVTSVSSEPADDVEVGIQRSLELPPIYSGAQMQAASESRRRYFHLLGSGVNPRNIAILGEVIAEFEPDVAYLWNILGTGGLGVLALLDHQGIPWVWHVMDLIPRQMCGFATPGDELAHEFGRFFKGRYVACSSRVLGEIRAGGLDLGDHVYLVPNWISGAQPPPRQEFLAGGVLRIASASATLSEQKGTGILIETAALLRDRGLRNVRIDVYGREEDPEFRQLLFKYDVQELVSLEGSRQHDHLLTLYGGYDVFAFPTWSREPFAFAPLEAAAAGCLPLLSGDCGNAEWMIDEVDCLKAPRTPEGFARRIEQILRNEVDVAGLARRAQRVVWRHFHVSSAAQMVERQLRAAAGERRRRRGRWNEFHTLARFAEGLIEAMIEER